MGNELRLHLDQHLLDRMEALHLLYQEAFPGIPLHRESLFRQALEEGLQTLLAELLTASAGRATAGLGRKHSKRWAAAREV